MRLTRAIIAALIVILIGIAAFQLISRRAPDPALAVPASTSATFPPLTSKPVARQTYSYSFSIDRSKAPELYYAELTYVAHLGQVSSPSAMIGGVSVVGTYDSARGDFVFTTNLGGAAALQFTSDTPPSNISVQKAALRGNKAWAWSHGMDDNVFLQAEVALIKAKGWRASLMMIAKDINDTRAESWILDAPALRELRNQGWSLADHSWDHDCTSTDATVLRKTITDGYNKLMEIVSTSDAPTYQVMAFVAPCFVSTYDPVFASLLADGTTTLRFNESQGNPLMNVDGADYTSGAVTAGAMSARVVKIGRDTTIETDPAKTIATLDWMAANQGASQHFWLNTLSHGNQEANLARVLDHAYAAYGPGGTDELWMAPSDEIYSYVLVRDSTVVSTGTLKARP